MLLFLAQLADIKKLLHSFNLAFYRSRRLIFICEFLVVKNERRIVTEYWPKNQLKQNLKNAGRIPSSIPEFLRLNYKKNTNKLIAKIDYLLG